MVSLVGVSSSDVTSGAALVSVTEETTGAALLMTMNAVCVVLVPLPSTIVSIRLWVDVHLSDSIAARNNAAVSEKVGGCRHHRKDH